MSHPVLIGWTELVDLPDWKIHGLKAKIDTGARTSCLHVESFAVLPEGRVRFDVVGRDPKKRRTVEAPITRHSVVRSSNGHEQERYFVETTLKLGPVSKRIEVSLVNRSRMRFKMLLGRTALKESFSVDVSRRYLMGRPPRKRPTTPTSSS